MKIQTEEIYRALRILFNKGDVFEIRVLNAIAKGGYRYPHTEYGYFDYDHLNDVVRDLTRIESCSGVYVVMNPVLPELLSRRANRLDFCQKGTALTSDSEILKRRWAFIDLDPKRPTGISSSDEDHNRALELAVEISVGMKKCGFEDAVIFDSGNGAHVLYSIDMPTDDNGLLKRFLTGLAGDWTENVEIDTSVFNAARLIRLPGTMNCKGDSTEKFPHRMARIYHVPDEICVTDTNAFVNIASSVVEQSSPALINVYHNSGMVSSDFSIDEWISKYCPEVDSPIAYNGGRKWLFPECPFNPAHKHGDAAIIQLSNGAIDFKCFHNHCQDYDWHSLRDLREPGWKENRHKRDDSDVNIGNIVSSPASMPEFSIPVFEDDEKTVCKEEDDTIPFPRHLLEIGGLIGKLMKADMDHAPVPNAPLALAGALCMMSFLTARKVKTESGLRSNIYVLGLAQSGSGKDFPRVINRAIMNEIGANAQIVDNIASGEGLEDYLIQNPATLWQCDEFYAVLQSMNADDRKSYNNNLMRYLLVLYTSANTTYNTRVKAGHSGVAVQYPHLSVFATTTMDGFTNNLNTAFLNDGMFARMNIIMADPPIRPQLRPEFILDDELKQLALNWCNYTPAGSGNLNLNAAVVPYTVSGRERAQALMDEQFDLCEQERKSADRKEWRESLWNRYFEISMRYALLYACSEATSPESAAITPEAIQWGADFVKWDIENKIRMVEKRFYRSEFEKMTETIINILKAWHNAKGKVAMPAHTFNIKTKFLDPRTKNQVIESLQSQKRLFYDVVATKGRPAKVFALPEFM